MKYIRTKDGRILEWEKLSEITKLSIDTCEETIKEADSIEELCDIFIVDDGSGEPLMLKCEYLEELEYWYNYNKKQQCKINNCYGAIWTDKGLLYVAKMNDKGEFELIWQKKKKSWKSLKIKKSCNT